MNDVRGVARLPEVERLCGMSRSSIYRLESLGQFPKRVRLSQRAVGWQRELIREWILSRQSADPSRAA
jgi:prophage regulatory protein